MPLRLPKIAILAADISRWWDCATNSFSSKWELFFDISEDEFNFILRVINASIGSRGVICTYHDNNTEARMKSEPMFYDNFPFYESIMNSSLIEEPVRYAAYDIEEFTQIGDFFEYEKTYYADYDARKLIDTRASMEHYSFYPVCNEQYALLRMAGFKNIIDLDEYRNVPDFDFLTKVSSASMHRPYMNN